MTEPAVREGRVVTTVLEEETCVPAHWA
jgi:hypothetical protein